MDLNSGLCSAANSSIISQPLMEPDEIHESSLQNITRSGHGVEEVGSVFFVRLMKPGKVNIVTMVIRYSDKPFLARSRAVAYAHSAPGTAELPSDITISICTRC